MQAIFCDVALELALQLIVSNWSGIPGAVLRLFRNDFVPGPASAAADFMECNYAGYATVMLSGQLTPPAKVSDGHWESVSNLYTYNAPAAGPGNLVYGPYVTVAGAPVACSRFDSPVTMAPGFPAFKLRLRVSSKSESLFQLF